MEISRTYFITEDADGKKDYQTSLKQLGEYAIFLKLKAHPDNNSGVIPIDNMSKLSRDFKCSVSVIKKAIASLKKQGLAEPVIYQGKEALRMRNVHTTDNYTRKHQVFDAEGKECYDVRLYFKLKKCVINHTSYEDLKLLLMADVAKCSQNQQLYMAEQYASRVSKLGFKGLRHKVSRGGMKKLVEQIRDQENSRTHTRKDAAAESMLVMTTDELLATSLNVSTPTANKYKRILHQKGLLLACNVLVPVTMDANHKFDNNAINALKSLGIAPNRTHFENGIAVNLIGTTILFPHDKKFRFKNNGRIKRFFVSEVFDMIEKANFDLQYSDDYIENLRQSRNKLSYCYIDDCNNNYGETIKRRIKRDNTISINNNSINTNSITYSKTYNQTNSLSNESNKPA